MFENKSVNQISLSTTQLPSTSIKKPFSGPSLHQKSESNLIALVRLSLLGSVNYASAESLPQIP